jgi:hypothetical protein
VDASGHHGHLVRWPKEQPTSGPSWSHDSRALAFATGTGLYSVRANGKDGGYVPLNWCDATSSWSGAAQSVAGDLGREPRAAALRALDPQPATERFDPIGEAGEP